jgi:fluoroacetyl-CoA thioesterase
MRDTLRPGLSGVEHHVVTAELGPHHLPDVVVLSTPAMINLMELTSHGLIAAHLDEDETSVGTHVDVSHVAAASGGEEVTVTSTLVGVTRNRLAFEIAVHVGSRLIGEGTHQRAVISMSRFT